ncbi:hypothetical protein IMSAG049_00117 [Clostridiales bacterium]|nr:hypothetical protein IMSAG049_00117 [Clostridiales bacterium]
MAKADKLTKRLSIIGIILIVLFMVLSRILTLSPKTMLSGIVVIWAGIIIVRMYIVNGRNKEYTKMLNHLNKILTEDNDPEKYVQKCLDYADKVEDEAFREMLKVNSAVGYSCMCKYEEAIDTLKSADMSLLNPSHRAVAQNNLAQFSYLLDRTDDGNRYVDDNFQELRKYIDNKSFAAAFMTTFAFYYYFKGVKHKALKYTENVIEFINNSGSTADGDMMVLKKMNELLVKIKAMPVPEDME